MFADCLTISLQSPFEFLFTIRNLQGFRRWAESFRGKNLYPSTMCPFAWDLLWMLYVSQHKLLSSFACFPVPAEHVSSKWTSVETIRSWCKTDCKCSEFKNRSFFRLYPLKNVKHRVTINTFMTSWSLSMSVYLISSIISLAACQSRAVRDSTLFLTIFNLFFIFSFNLSLSFIASFIILLFIYIYIWNI